MYNIIVCLFKFNTMYGSTPANVLNYLYKGNLSMVFTSNVIGSLFERSDKHMWEERGER